MRYVGGQSARAEGGRHARGAPAAENDTAHPASATRTLFESALESNGESIQSFDVTLEVDNIATIKDLIRKDLGVSILPRSACLDALRKGKIAALPVENLSMVRETRIVYNKDFTHTDMLNEIIKTYGSTVMN